MLFPISFSIPEELIIPYVPFKSLHTAKHDYQFDDSDSYLKNYRNAIFGGTSLKCGWDCFRHYEILSQGTIPYFYELEKCPKNTLFNFPKETLIRLRDTYGILSFDEIMKTSSSVLYSEIDDLLKYTRNNLTTRCSAQYILSKTEQPNAKKILFLNNVSTNGDYMCEMLAHGLYRLTEGGVDMYPDYEYRYKNYDIEKIKSLYGKGFNYTRLLEEKKVISECEMMQRIKERYYEHIILCFQCHSDSQMPFTTNASIDIRGYYEPSEISLVCGADCDNYWSSELDWYIRRNHSCPLSVAAKVNNVFVREFGD